MLMAGHEALQQRRVEAMEVAESVGDGETRFQVEMKSAMAERSKIDERGAGMDGLQGESEIYGDRSGSAAALGIDDGEDFVAGVFAPGLAASGGKADEGIKEVGGCGGTLDVFADAGTHGIDDELRLVHGAKGKDGGVGDFLMNQLDGTHGRSGVLGRDINQDDLGCVALGFKDGGIAGGERKSGMGADRAGDAGSVDQDLEHGTLIIVSGKDSN